MIADFVFDFGNVLTRYDLKVFAAGLTGSRQAGEHLYDMTLGNRPVWRKYDAGLLSEEQAIALLCRDAEPELHKQIDEFVKTLHTCFSQYDEMVPVLRSLKEKGYRTYLLSNFPKEPFEQIARRCPILDLIDFPVVSYRIHLCKPEREIYDYLLDTCGLQANQTLFADDTEECVRGALDAGMNGFVFTTADKYREHLKLLEIM